MQLHSISSFSRFDYGRWLYSFVYAGKISVLAVVFLLSSFLIQPFHQALANEAVAEDLDTGEESTPYEEENSIDVSESTTNTEDNIAVEEVDESTEEVQTEEGFNEDIEENLGSDDTSDTATTTDDTDNDNPVNDEETPSDAGESDDDTPIDGDESASSSDDIPAEIGDDVIADGVTDIVQEVVTLTRQLVTEENYYQFSRQSCSPVGDGTFYCSTRTETDIDPDSAVYAGKGEGGDMEIFMRTSKGTVEQITDNEYDDTAPDFDGESMRIVWQQLIDGRYQIMSHDLRDEKTTQLTFSQTNSMEPKVSAEGITWQMWDGNDWEIIFFNGKTVEQITNNEIQDVTPVVEDGYILWSILGGEEQEARVYSLDKKETLTISGHEGGAIVNPRFVLVYDTMFDNGDIVTQGFDPVTGLSAPISAQPAEAPIDIPEADPVGEIRALIQNKSFGKEQKVVTDISGNNATSTDLDLGAKSSTTIQSTLDLNGLPDHEGGGDLGILSTSSVDIPSFELTEYDLVITPHATSSSLDDIADELPTIFTLDPSSTQ